MKTALKNQAGFTLIELILVIAILGILAVAASPVVVDVLGQAKPAGRDSVVANVQTGINMKYNGELSTNPDTAAFTTTLDSASSAACTASNPCFGTVLQTPVTKNWTKNSATEYHFDLSGAESTCTYDTSTGSFSCVAD